MNLIRAKDYEQLSRIAAGIIAAQAYPGSLFRERKAGAGSGHNAV